MVRRIPFRGLSTQELQNLGLCAVLVFYLLLFWWGFASGGLFLGLGGDYRCYWSAGYLARTQGFAQAYNLASLSAVQETMLPPPYNQNLSPLPMFFLPVFVLPFWLLSYLEPSLSFAVWTFLSVAAFCFYLFFLFRSWSGNSISPRLYIVLLLCFPVFSTLYWGTADVWLFIALGEFIRNGWNGRHFPAGLWLGLMWLKFQTLVLLIPALVLRRAWRALAGFLAMSGLLIGLSWLMVGTPGMVSLMNLWLGLAGGMPTSSAERMMSWRMLAVNLGHLVPAGLAWGVALIGMIVTLWLTWRCWAVNLFNEPERSALALLGLLAATNLLSWHLHFHTAITALPAMAYLLMQKRLPIALPLLWVYLPSAGFFLSLVMSILNLPTVSNLIYGLSGLTANLCVLVWVRESLRAP
ncbi:MAG: DUF2029 domain-containing protein [Anaerolineae bacterium]|nr:DUF2029 domain-containing protein [Anaerolineae bacterium]